MNRRYEDFTSAEKARLRSFYDGMPDEDEPPFPLAGMKDIIADISTLVSTLRKTGVVNIAVNVDSKGNATGVRILEYQDIEMAKAIAYVLVKTKYKPAACAGVACSMEFPFCTVLQLD